MATKYEALVEARLVGSSLKSQIEAQGKSANLNISNITVNTAGLVASIQQALSNTDFKINFSNITSQAQSTGKTIGETIRKEVQSSLGNVKLGQGLNTQTNSLQTQLTAIKSITLSNNIEAWMNKNTVAAKKFHDELEITLARLKGNPSDTASLRIASAEFAKIKAQAKSAGVAVSQFALNIKTVGLQVIGFGSAYQGIMKVVQTVKKGITDVVNLDTALVDLKKTTTMSGNDLEQFYKDANTEAKNLGVTTKDIIQTAANWSRLGYSSKEEATLMSKYAAQFAAISPGMDIEASTKGLVSVMKAFHVQTDDVLDGIMSKVNIVGNNFAVTNADIIDGMSRMSAAMAVMGQDIDSTIALFTSANEVLQNSATTSTALRSMSLRMRGFDEETEMLSDDLVDITGKIVDLTKTASKPMGVSIFTDETQTHYKDLVDYFRELSEIWDEMSEKNRNQLLNDLFGKRGSQVGAAIIANFQAVENSLELMQQSAGEADREMGIIMESLEFKLNALKETAVGIAQNLFPRDMLGDIIDGLTKVLSLIQQLTGALGPLGTLLAGGAIAGGIKLLKNLDWPNQGTLNSEIFKQVYYGQGHVVMVA